jgi:hypothetical protein
MTHRLRLSGARLRLLLVAAVASLAVWAWSKWGPLPATVHSAASAAQAVAPRSAPFPNATGDGERRVVTAERQGSTTSSVSPAPKALSASNGAPASQANRFSLIGTTLSGDLRIALLRENATGESREVVDGGRVDDMTVRVVAGNRVLLRAGSRTEELELQSARDSPGARAEPSSSPRVPPVDDVSANHSDLASVPVTPPTEADVRALIEDGKPVPNPS